jgi:nicotinic acid mononucleotide adenylyltransferase
MEKIQKDPENSNYEFWAIIGTDLVDSLHLWDEGIKLKKEVNFVIASRLNCPYDP